jgi:superfamily II DNA or RNA helicase
MSLESCLSKLDAFEKFSGENRNNGTAFELGNHQLVPIFDISEGDLRRFALAYGTGAGKTVIPVEIVKQLNKKGENSKVLVIAPKQTLLENWNEKTLEKYGCSMNVHNVNVREDRNIPDNADFVTVNYDKLIGSLGYLDQLVDYASGANLIVVDEFHNVKNRNAKTSKGFQKIIEASKGARLVALSATPCPDKLSDAGMMLYTLDPERYGHYKDTVFDINSDSEALWEMREKGQIRFFDAQSVASFHNLPRFDERQPVLVSMPQKYVGAYFGAFSDAFSISKLHNLERIAIESMIASDDTKDFLSDRLKKGHVLNFFSHLIHEPRKGSQDEAIFRRLEDLLFYIGAKNVRTIRGATKDDERREIQKAMHKGKLDALINQWDCTSEGFSEAAGNRAVSIIPLRSPYSPGRYVQIVGRSHRPGQFAPVEYVELHAHSEDLLSKIDGFVQDYAKQHDVKIKSTWAPSLFHRDSYLVRKGKEQAIFVLFTQRSHEAFNAEDLDINSLTQYAKRLSRKRIIDFSEKERDAFGVGTRSVMRYVGRNYEGGLKSDAEPLGKDYNRDNIILYTPGKINFFLSEAIEKIKSKEGEGKESWKIADLGCCSSAVFAQARMLYQALHSPESGFDYIVNVDGHPGFIRNAKSTLKKGDWLKEILNLKIPDFSEEEIERAREKLRRHDVMRNLEFLVADFTKDDFGKDYDAIVTSQCLQYNNQVNDRDIEKIVVNVNRALRERGNYLSVLTSNTRKGPSTTNQHDVENFEKILGLYGFEIEKYGHVSGKIKKKEVLKPFHYFHAVKIDEAPSELRSVKIDPVMYSDTVEYLTGGYKEQRIRRASVKEDHKTTEVPSRYEDGEGKEFEP